MFLNTDYIAHLIFALVASYLMKPIVARSAHNEVQCAIRMSLIISGIVFSYMI